MSDKTYGLCIEQTFVLIATLPPVLLAIFPLLFRVTPGRQDSIQLDFAGRSVLKKT